MLKSKNLLLLILVMVSLISGIYFYFISILYKYLIFPIATSIYVQILEKKKVAFLIKRDTIIEKTVYVYMFKGTITEEEEYLEDVYFISPELMKKTYRRILLIKLITYVGIIFLGVYLMFFYSFFQGFNMIFSIFLMLYLFYFEIIKIYSLYNKIGNENYNLVDVEIENTKYYSAFMEKKNEKGTEFENLYNILF